MAHILVIEDNTTMREGIIQVLETMGHDVYGAANGKEGLQYYSITHPELVITDLKMDEIDGMQVLKEIKEQSQHSLVLMITAFGTIELAVEAMQLGAFDFITKPFPPDLLRVKVKKALDVIQTRAENKYLRQEQMKKTSNMLIGKSPSIQKIQQQIEKAAPSDSTILITGESGTGKDLLSRAVHQLSYRSNKPFVKVDCSSLNENLLESELFGHERGAFTGAHQRKQGRFELADGGTIFLDEIGEIPQPVQLKLLRVLQDRSFERVGGTKTIHIDVRVIGATNKNLQDQITQGNFREDLFYRLNIVPIELPPLRKRKKDIPDLIDFFLQKYNNKTGNQLAISEKAMSAFTNYSWPGNIRELQNIVERMTVMVSGGKIELEDIPLEIQNNVIIDSGVSSMEEVGLQESLEKLEKTLIIQALDQTGGVKTKAAEKLGVKTSALYYKLEKYGIE